MIDSQLSAIRISLGASPDLFGVRNLSVSGTPLTNTSPIDGEGLIDHVLRIRGGWDLLYFARVLGSANAFKEGDAIVGLAAENEPARRDARRLLAATTLAEIDAHPIFADDMYHRLSEAISPLSQAAMADWTFARLREFLLSADEPVIQELMPGLSSDVIGCIVKILSDAELVEVSAKIFNPLPGTTIGAKGRLGARIQPNSPTDHPEDIRWQIFNGWSYAVGDVLLGNNPVSSEPTQVASIQRTLRDVLRTFELEDVMPHCVLAHIDVQAEVEATEPGSTALWFQSIAGSDAANATFDVSLPDLLAHADARTGPYGFYFETGQGADFTNGHAQGMDMVLHESRKYGLARLIRRRVEIARGDRAWVHVNDVAGFIGPEVFRTRDQLIRSALEDVLMGKLHGLCIGVDVCSTLHMDVSLDDLDICLDAIAPANPAYLMALPTKIDPMLGYLTTSFQDHVRLRARHGFAIEDRMWAFFKTLGVIDEQGQPTEHFGDPNWVHLQYARRRGDGRLDAEILAEGVDGMAKVRARGVFLATGWGADHGTLHPVLDAEMHRIYDGAKQAILAEFTPRFRASMPDGILLASTSANRDDYILHPATGEVLNDSSVEIVRQLRVRHAGAYNLQIIVSDGLNALAIMDHDQLDQFLSTLRESLQNAGHRAAPETLLIDRGRVRAGYQIGEVLFGDVAGPSTVLHVIGERPGTGHDTFSMYMTKADGVTWGHRGTVDHDITRVIAGIAQTALDPRRAADDAVRLLMNIDAASTA